MRNPFVDWINRVLPTRSTLPRSLELKPGKTYIVLYDERFLSRTEMWITSQRLNTQGIQAIFIGCDESHPGYVPP